MKDASGKGDSGPPTGTGVYAGLIALILVIAALVVLAAQNTQSVTIRWLGLSWTTPLIAVLLGVMLVTVVLDEVIGAVWRRRRRRILSERQELEVRRAQQSETPSPDTTTEKETSTT
jgi:uncharacterized integral membrane protein